MRFFCVGKKKRNKKKERKKVKEEKKDKKSLFSLYVNADSYTRNYSKLKRAEEESVSLRG